MGRQVRARTGSGVCGWVCTSVDVARRARRAHERPTPLTCVADCRGAQVCRSLSKELIRMRDIRFSLGHRTEEFRAPAQVLSKLEGTVAIIAPSTEPTAHSASALKGTPLKGLPFGRAVLDILELSARPSNGRFIFSTLTELDLTGTVQSSIEDYGAIRSIPVPARSPLRAQPSPLGHRSHLAG